MRSRWQNAGDHVDRNDHTKDGGESLPPRPGPPPRARSAVSPRCFPLRGQGGALGGAGRGRQVRGRRQCTGAGSPVSGPRRARTAWRARRAALSPRSAPAPAPAPASAPLAPAVPWRCYRGCAAAFPPRKRPTAADSTEIDPGVTKLREEKTKGLEAPSFPSVAVGVPDASGRTNPVAFMSNVLCCVPAVSCTRQSYLSSWERTGRALAIWPLERLSDLFQQGKTFWQAVPERTGVSGE
ncbi:uncharacterized protein LOC115307351 [Manacus vitellinus]|uniref:uncharacterized protein LOC115307351 n=1 Tax=Manacus vitellinus TaxID=328815 RepID=UPI00115CF7D4|nr:uncharacterized protein LOC115307351 [Manacus vitellinus]